MVFFNLLFFFMFFFGDFCNFIGIKNMRDFISDFRNIGVRCLRVSFDG